jgi:hypothetical protein
MEMKARRSKQSQHPESAAAVKNYHDLYRRICLYRAAFGLEDLAVTNRQQRITEYWGLRRPAVCLWRARPLNR